MRRRKQSGTAFFVADKGFPSPGAALSYAQGLACRWDQSEERSFYVRDALDNAVFRVDLIAGVVYTTAVREAA